MAYSFPMPHSGRFAHKACSASGHPMPAILEPLEESIHSFSTQVFKLGATPDTPEGWIKLGNVLADPGSMLDIQISMIRTMTGTRFPSQYRFNLIANADGGVETICYFGGQLICLYGSDYDGVDDDPLLGVALVRGLGYDPNRADLLLHHGPGGFSAVVTISDPDEILEWDPEASSDPGTGTDTSIATRRILVAS